MVAAVLVIGIVAFRRPLAQWLWPDTRIQQLLAQGERALSQGRLTAADGSGARESFQAALALDSDRSEAGDGLARTGLAALAQGRQALARDDIGGARRALELAQRLQVPQAQSDALALQLRRYQAARAGLDDLVARARQAHEAGRLDGDPDSALPLYQRVLDLAPDRLDALEGREDALQDLLQQARREQAGGDLAAAAQKVRAARGYDPGHADLPASEAALNDALQQRLRRAETRLRQGRLAQAEEDLRLVAELRPDDPAIARDSEHLAAAYAAEATRRASDFAFEDAEAAIARARAWSPESAGVRAAEQAIVRARQAQAPQPTLAPAARAKKLRQLLARIEAAEAKQHWLTPPGESAFDALREAQSLAPHDARVRAAATRLVPQTRACFEDALRANRVRGAQSCLDAWQALAVRDASLADARRRLAQRWIAVGSERLGAGDAAFAAEAARQARRLDPAAPELADFQARVRAAEGRDR
ncbi:hypothetical protein P6166_10915 [Stenotrophomonas sp. HITSZ_GD]|uniref:hypothetical protein n=1 Tax=Stenotrophomonas sp. HITSZ_GD TaxID=3037248 RepID=UPI00240DDA33|nr:hypothetical protein [Stenotrophomonas sp. HITSZ_GD]MDG2525863.1 hypothetical protein [Stenotrophomonas sp. HITSZ_GD]